MKIIQGLLDYSKPWIYPNLYLFTGNAAITHDGRLVMGRGAAKQCHDTYPGIDRELAQKVVKQPEKHILWIEIEDGQMLGWFKVKHHWADQADIRLIEQSTASLSQLANRRPHLQFHMNYPGIGNGRLTEHEVGHIIHHMPDNISVYR
jgi:hypothetical protein